MEVAAGFAGLPVRAIVEDAMAVIGTVDALGLTAGHDSGALDIDIGPGCHLAPLEECHQTYLIPAIGIADAARTAVKVVAITEIEKQRETRARAVSVSRGEMVATVRPIADNTVFVDPLEIAPLANRVC